ncbi:CHAT domain-containing protein [Desulfonema magnum]|uniref:CHAT domain-containing protein n=1 Tax=Desulfonema magnum TaxID=45655 RepID=A0A975BIE6_9BACT|nr:CHAT domain-containing protein [Desulfonema magnum]QTA86092.1 CHAT domain-containing protein [Desulfonema magnum]
MKKTIYLEATLDKDFLKIGIHVPDRPLWTYEEVSASMENVEKHCRKMVETLNRKSRKGGEVSDAGENLKAVGRMLSDDLLTPRIKEYLEISTADYLILSLDDHLVHIPWELLYIGDDFLCQRFNMGRYVKTRQKVTENSHRKLSGPLEMWILANPGGDLPSALSEGMKIFRYTNQMNQEEMVVNPSLDSDIRPDRIKLKIKDYDFVHFAGHADYNPHDPGVSGWKLTDGVFKADKIHKMAGGAPMPALVFSNACQSARTEEWEWKEELSPFSDSGQGKGDKNGSFGLANAFLFAGVRHYVGTFWEIMDEPSSHFALEFYKHLLAGDTVGEAIKKARLTLIEEYGADSIAWASYLLYGDPRFSYFGQNEEAEEPVEFESSVIPAPRDNSRKLRTSGTSKKIPKPEDAKRYGPADEHKQKKVRNWLIAFFACIFLVFGGFLSYVSITESLRLERTRFMAEETGKKQERICHLIEKFREITPSPSPDEFSSDELPLTLAIVYDSVKSAYSQGKEGFISSAIAKEIKNKYPHIKLLERKQFHIVLEELNLALSPLVPMGRKLQPKLLNAKLILFIETDRTFFESFVLMRLINTETGESVAFSIKKLESGGLASQNLSEDILKTLKERYPKS